MEPGDSELATLSIESDSNLPDHQPTLTEPSPLEELSFQQIPAIEADSPINDFSLLQCSLSTIDCNQDSANLQKTDRSRCSESQDKLAQLRSQVEQALLVIDRQQIELECLREQREMLLQGPLIKMPTRQRIRDCFGDELETIGELEPLQMYVVNGRFRFEEMRRWKRIGERNRKMCVRRYHM